MAVKNIEQTNLLKNLNGKWSFSLDPENSQSWYKGETEIPQDTIQVPGSWEEQGFGSPSTHRPIGTWKKDREYEGIAWYIRDIQIPQSYDGLLMNLILKGVRWFTELWIDGKSVGRGESIATPHQFNITPFVQAGKTHRFVIEVDNRMDFSLHESHIHSYHTATNWGGITGGIELEAILPHSFEDIKIISNTVKKNVNVQVKINRTGCLDQCNWSLSAKILQSDGTVIGTEEKDLKEVDAANPQYIQETITLQLGENAELWSPQNPYLYKIELTLNHNGAVYDQKQIPFGLRSIDTDRNQILVNNQPVFLTGYVDCCIFPQTGYPVWDLNHYKKQFQIVKSYGFNHVRLHGWNAPEPFWQAADEEGMLVQTELPHWSVHYRSRQKESLVEVHSFLKRELERIIQNLHAHPSFVMLSMGNELTSVEGHPQLNELVQHARKLDPTRMYTDNTGFGELPANDREGDYYIPTLNWHPPYHIDQAANPDSTLDYSEVTKLETKPIIAHEHGQFTMYVRPEEANKYEGILKPHWLETTKETLAVKGLENRVDEFIEATGVHMVRTLKEAMEKARRTHGLSGIQLLDIRDFPGQGHATVGILDVFWNSKNVVNPTIFRQFNEQTVLLMRSKKRTYYSNEILTANLEVSHFGKQGLSGELTWSLTSGDDILAEEKQTFDHIGGGGLTELSPVRVSIPDGESRKLVLCAELTIDGETVENQWDFWAFPHQELPSNRERIWTNIDSLRSVLYGARFEDSIGIKQHSYQNEKNVDLAITDQLSRDVLQYLVDGGLVWLMAQENNQYDEVPTRYLPIFWNYLWFPEQSGTTMGMIVNSHPAVNNFPNDGFSDWHWYHLVDRSIALNLDLIPKVEPIVEVVDNFNRAKRLAYAFEVKVGKGKLFVSTFNLTNKQTMKLPEIHSLFTEQLRYLNSNSFQPDVSLSVGELLGIFKVKKI